MIVPLAYIAAAVLRELLREGVCDQNERGVELRDECAFIVNQHILLAVLHVDRISRV